MPRLLSFFRNCLFALTLTSAAALATELTPAQEGTLVYSGVKTLGASVERILMQSCYLSAGHENGYAQAIADDIVQFEAMVSTLREGDAEQGIPAIRASGTLRALNGINDEWRDFSDFARFATRGAMSEPYFVRMYDLHTDLLEDVKSLSDRLSAKYSGARISSWTSTTLINLADVRTDATLLATYHCMLAEDMRSEDARQKLQQMYAQLQLDVERAMGGVPEERLHRASDDKQIYLECVLETVERLDAYVVPALQSGHRPTADELISAKEHMRELLRVTDGALNVFFAEMMGAEVDVTGCGASS